MPLKELSINEKKAIMATVKKLNETYGDGEVTKINYGASVPATHKKDQSVGLEFQASISGSTRRTKRPISVFEGKSPNSLRVVLAGQQGVARFQEAKSKTAKAVDKAAPEKPKARGRKPALAAA